MIDELTRNGASIEFIGAKPVIKLASDEQRTNKNRQTKKIIQNYPAAKGKETSLY